MPKSLTQGLKELGHRSTEGLMYRVEQVCFGGCCETRMVRRFQASEQRTKKLTDGMSGSDVQVTTVR
jgi:hypothetical protein